MYLFVPHPQTLYQPHGWGLAGSGTWIFYVRFSTLVRKENKTFFKTKNVSNAELQC